MGGRFLLQVLANSTKMCYTYDSLGRVTSRTVKSLADGSVISTETYTHDAAGNLTSAPDDTFTYDTNNRLVTYNGNTVTYDLDGNMLNDGVCQYTYDSANRLTSFGGHTYTYRSDDIRIRDLCAAEDTTYTYDTNCKLSKLLTKTTNGTTTKYVYGRGLIGEEVSGAFKTYHFDCRGSTVAITDASGNITDTFAYDTYGNLTSRTGTSAIIFLYNGRDGVITEDTGLYYMRARYYSPDMRRFINADIVAGEISNAVTLNRFAYANGNPVSNIDPFGLSAERGGDDGATRSFTNYVVNGFGYKSIAEQRDTVDYGEKTYKGDSVYFVTTTIYGLFVDLEFTYVVSDGVISFDFDENEYFSALISGKSDNLAKAIYETTKSISDDYLFARTKEGIDTELQVHWLLYKNEYEVERTKTTDMGAAISNHPGYDYNAYVFELIDLGKNYVVSALGGARGLYVVIMDYIH